MPDTPVTPAPSAIQDAATITIQAVLVLYRMPLAASQAYAAWQRYTAAHPDFASRVDLMVCDNTPGPSQPRPTDFAGEYVAQPENPGLAASYQRALLRAEKTGATWLLLLDQDTALTSEFFDELGRLSQDIATNHAVAAIVPKLLENDQVQSPLPGRAAKRRPPLPRDAAGLLSDNSLHIFNSGACLRVASLRAIGGFPQEFWLDCLDHAVFHLLRQEGGRVYLMHATLQHRLSTNTQPNPADPAYIARHKNMLTAEALFHARYATPSERRIYRLHLLRSTLFAAIRRRDFATAWRNLKAAAAVRIKP